MRIALMLVLVSGCATTRQSTPSPLTFTYLGVAGWSITDGTHVVLVDPYFSRPEDPFKDPVSDAAAVAAYSPARADVVLVGHAHVDHALDAPSVARHSGAALVGSAALAQQAARIGVNAITVHGGEQLDFSGVSVRVLRSLHSLIGPEHGESIETFAYVVGIGGRSVLVFGTANFVESELAGLRPDVAIIAPGLREKVPDYSCRLMKALGAPATVFVTHFDAWRKPVDTPLDAETAADVNAFTNEIHSCAPSTKVIVPTPLTPTSA